jgi:hypothetical protein
MQLLNSSFAMEKKETKKNIPDKNIWDDKSSPSKSNRAIFGENDLTGFIIIVVFGIFLALMLGTSGR